MRYIDIRIKKLYSYTKVLTYINGELWESYLSNEELKEYRDQLKLALEEIESAIEEDHHDE